ncbi:hypothetical protein H9P43_007933 [Blastocladiella emersonii ATCC 22665]|nr:hypothetical protein H9P43_007933 [Blastocladiella emersonii ATCC 22665]
MWRVKGRERGRFFFRILVLDLRNLSDPVQSLAEHTDTATCLALSPSDSTLASVSFDKTVKLWNVDSATAKLTLSSARDPGLKGLVACAWCLDHEGVLAVSGHKGSAVLDLGADDVVLPITTLGADYPIVI